MRLLHGRNIRLVDREWRPARASCLLALHMAATGPLLAASKTFRKQTRPLKALLWDMYTDTGCAGDLGPGSGFETKRQKRLLMADMARYLLENGHTWPPLVAVLSPSGAQGEYMQWINHDKATIEKCLRSLAGMPEQTGGAMLLDEPRDTSLDSSDGEVSSDQQLQHDAAAAPITAVTSSAAAGASSARAGGRTSGSAPAASGGPRRPKHIFVQTKLFMEGLRAITQLRTGTVVSRADVLDLVWWLHAGASQARLRESSELPLMLHLADHCTSLFACIRRTLDADVHNQVHRLLAALAGDSRGSTEAVRERLGLTGAVWDAETASTQALLAHLRHTGVFVQSSAWHATHRADYSYAVLRKLVCRRYRDGLPEAVSLEPLLAAMATYTRRRAVLTSDDAAAQASE